MRRRAEQVAFSTLPDEDGSAAVTKDEQVSLAVPRLDAVATQQGSHVTTSTGTLSSCNGTVAWDASGCGSEKLPDFYASIDWADGRVAIDFEQYRSPGLTCPLVQRDQDVRLDARAQAREVSAPPRRLACCGP